MTTFYQAKPPPDPINWTHWWLRMVERGCLMVEIEAEPRFRDHAYLVLCRCCRPQAHDNIVYVSPNDLTVVPE